MTLSITLVIFQMFCFFNKVETTRNLRWSTKLGDELETCLVPSNSMDPKCREPLKSSRLWALAGREKNANLLRLDFWWNGGARHCPCTVHLHDRRSSEPHAPDPPIYFSYWLPSGSSFVAGNPKKDGHSSNNGWPQNEDQDISLLKNGLLVPVTGRISAGPCGRH